MPNAIELTDLTFAVPSKTILDSLSFTVEEGSFTVVIGENGAGKTTLLKLLMGFAKPTSGNICVLGKKPWEDPFLDRNKIAYLAERLSPPVDWSVAEYLTFHSHFYPNYSSEKENHYLKLFQISRKSRIGQLSTGEKRRVQIVGGLSYSPRLVIVDEITAVLDIIGRMRFLNVMKEIRNSGGTVIMATNIIDDVDTYASHIVVLHNGRLVCAETREKFIEKTQATNAAQGIAKVIEVEMEKNA